jgi:RND family efflux transporter MFP subunit
VIQIAPDVTGLVTEVDVADNAPVHKGQVLFVLDKPRFKLALDQAEAAVLAQTTALAQARREDARNHKLGDLASAETVEEGAAKVAQLQAAVAQAIAARNTAALNLERTTVFAPADGVAANVQLRPGDYLAAGRPALGLVDSGSLHVDGYFEETKLPLIQVGDRVSVQLVGEQRLLQGHRERSASGDLLANVNPTFSWVRLAQRIPVRIKLDPPPPGVRLIAGRTATVIVHPSRPARAAQTGVH